MAPVGKRGRLYTTGDIADLLGVTRQQAWNLSRRKGFPDPYDEWTNGLAVWAVDKVDRWITANRSKLAEDSES